MIGKIVAVTKDILVADDSKGLVQQLVPALVERGYSVDFCYQALEAVQLIIKNTYKLVLLDHNFRPDEITGSEVLDSTKEARAKKPHMIIFGNSSDREYNEEMIERGADKRSPGKGDTRKLFGIIDEALRGIKYDPSKDPWDF